MGSLYCLFVLICFTAAGRTFPTSSNIIDYPYFASIELNGDYICGATIVDDTYVISTNSCVGALDVSKLSVRVGTDMLGHRGSVFEVTAVIPYTPSDPFHHGPSITADMAMVKVAVSFPFNPRIMWANPSINGVQEYGEGVVTGWTDTQTRGSSLSSMSVYVLPSVNCSEMYQGIMNITSNMFCLRPTESTSRVCLAGLGSPFYSNEQFYGLVTYNPGCSNTSLALVVTQLAGFTGYILSTLCDMSSLF